MPVINELLNKDMAVGYIGFDPIADSLHAGNLAQIMSPIHFQRAGHKPAALVGGVIDMVGGPSKCHRLINSCFTLLLIFFAAIANAQHITLLQSGTSASIRGLSVIDDKTAWLSGSNGYVALTADGGKTWAWQKVKGFEHADFRSIYAFSDKEAVVMASGTPALLLKTINGGKSWQVKYRNTDTACFLDAMDFNDPQHGFVLGDPINNKFVLLETKNGGQTWQMFKNMPDVSPGEAAFAASSTCLRTTDQHILIVTGGPSSRLFIYSTKNKSWRIMPVAITKGKSSTGAFSIAQGNNALVVVGGDYQQDKRRDSTACYSTNNGSTWQPATIPPACYQSCVEFIAGDTFFSTGTPGTNITTNGGKTWAKIDTASFNVCRKARHGKLVILAGNDGKIAIFKP